MNDDLQLTDEQLRLATSRSLPAGTQLDSDSAAARESFLALGAALESSTSNLDEAALIARLSISREQTCSRSPATHNWWPLILCGALAASALFAIVRIASMMPQADTPIANLNPPNRPAPIQPWTPAFNDPLDDEIALAAATIEQYWQSRPRFRWFVVRHERSH